MVTLASGETVTYKIEDTASGGGAWLQLFMVGRQPGSDVGRAWCFTPSPCAPSAGGGAARSGADVGDQGGRLRVSGVVDVAERHRALQGTEHVLGHG